MTLGKSARGAAAFLLCAAWSCAASPAEVARIAEEIRYENAARTYYERFTSQRWQGSKIAAKSRLEGEERTPLERVSVAVHDCSDERYRCLFGTYRVFAVPRGPLSPNAAYVAGGSSFRVEECFRGNATTCQVALISSDCQQLSGLDACKEVVGGRTQSAKPGPVLYFIFNVDIGVTAYGSEAEPAQTADARRAVAVEMILRGEHGLLVRP